MHDRCPADAFGSDASSTRLQHEVCAALSENPTSGERSCKIACGRREAQRAVLQPRMVRERMLWTAKCLLYCLCGTFALGRIEGLLNPAVWWLAHQSGMLTMSRPLFTATFYLPLALLYGCVAGVIPIHSLRELLASALGLFRFRSHAGSQRDLSRPLLWSWAPVGTIFTLRFLSFRANHSVLPGASYSNRYEHFFGSLPTLSIAESHTWIFDRFALTAPTLFLISYAATVYLRHRLTAPKEAKSD